MNDVVIEPGLPLPPVGEGEDEGGEPAASVSISVHGPVGHLMAHAYLDDVDDVDDERLAALVLRVANGVCAAYGVGVWMEFQRLAKELA